MNRKIKPYPEVPPDNIEPVDPEWQDIGELVIMAVMLMLALFVVMLAALLGLTVAALL